MMFEGGSSTIKGQSARWRYGVATALILVVAVASLVAHGALSRAPFLLPALAILLSAYLGGLGPGLLATVACSALAGIIFLTPEDASVLRDWPYLTRFALTIVGGALASVLMGTLRRERARAQQAAAENARLYQDALVARHEVLAQSKQLEAVLAGISDGVTAQGPDGRLLYANEAGARITGFDNVAAMLATPVHEILDRFEILHEDGQPFPAEELPGRLALGGERPDPTLVRYRLKGSREERWVIVTAEPLRDENGEVIMAINVMRDVTLEKLAEARKAAFLSALAHDLKTPLTAIKGVSQLMLRRLNQADRPTTDWLADELERLDLTAERMARLVDELLELEHVGGVEGAALAESSFDLTELAQQVAAELRSTTTSHHLQVVCFDGAVVGSWDRERVGRVLANLIENAIKYSPGGEISIDIRRMDGAASVSVRDQGIGVPEGERARIFDRFQRGSNVPNDVPGTGVGLAYAHWVVAQHGGTLRVDSNAGPGSCFVVELPLEHAPGVPEGASLAGA